MNNIGVGGLLTILVLLFLAFVGFVIYFIFKLLQFVLVSVNLYKKMVRRQDAIIKLLIDIRDNTKKFVIGDSEVLDMETKDDEEKELRTVEEPFKKEPSEFICPNCRQLVSKEETFCPKCGERLI